MRLQRSFFSPALVCASLVLFSVPQAFGAEPPAPSHPSSGPLTGTVQKPVGTGAGQTGAVARGTFNREIVRILQSHCQTCHHTGDIAPFPLTTYREAYPYRDQIRTVTSSRLMPPWHVVNSCSKFDGDPSLTDEEIRTIAGWVANGAPEGSAQDLPAPISFGTKSKPRWLLLVNPNSWRKFVPGCV